ncbi:hypothetical protein FHX81_0477 [Saccharothrix saharensis]|uniref:Uncharacterized protein n=1 Tax=Saccharothrix saharensis TaxID=571190 RepID=A0A543J5Y6_9PSEU|nr:hypothetical protein [Saccharothrix saharensis]TQM78217.1 hypothetical protein FHX81_0477 [Saccharothrix saharensis]
MDLFTVSPTGTVSSTWKNPDETWRPWFPIPSSTAAPKSVVTAVAPYTNEMDLFTLEHGGGMRWTSWHNGRGTWRDL